MRIKLLDYQHRMIAARQPYTAIIGGTGTGKTFLEPIWLYLRMAARPGCEWIVCAPTNQMLKRNPIAYIRKYFTENGIVERWTDAYNKVEGLLEVNGKGVRGTVHFISAENPDRMQGVHAAGILADEAGQYFREWWDVAIQRVSFKRGQIALMTTPYSMNWLKTEIYDSWLKGHRDYHVETPKSIQNPYYPIEQIRRAKEHLPDWKFKMMYLGEFTKPAGLVYPEYQVVKSFNIPDDWTLIRGLDFGFNHPVAVPLIAESPEGDLYVIDDFKQSGLDLDQIQEHLVKKDCLTYADYAQRTDLETLNNRGMNIRFADKAVIAGIMFVNGLLKTGKLKVFDKCKALIDELNSYEWATDRNEQALDVPNKRAGNDDLLDALRYALYTRYGQNDGSVQLFV